MKTLTISSNVRTTLRIVLFLALAIALCVFCASLGGFAQFLALPVIGVTALILEGICRFNENSPA